MEALDPPQPHSENPTEPTQASPGLSAGAAALKQSDTHSNANLGNVHAHRLQLMMQPDKADEAPKVGFAIDPHAQGLEIQTTNPFASSPIGAWTNTTQAQAPAQNHFLAGTVMGNMMGPADAKAPSPFDTAMQMGQAMSGASVVGTPAPYAHVGSAENPVILWDNGGGVVGPNPEVTSGNVSGYGPPPFATGANNQEILPKGSNVGSHALNQLASSTDSPKKKRRPPKGGRTTMNSTILRPQPGTNVEVLEQIQIAMQGTWMDKSLNEFKRRNLLLKEMDQAQQIYGKETDVYRMLEEEYGKLGGRVERIGMKRLQSLGRNQQPVKISGFGTRSDGTKYPLFGNSASSNITFPTVSRRAQRSQAPPPKAKADVTQQVLAKSLNKAKASVDPKFAKKDMGRKAAQERVAVALGKLKTFLRILRATTATAILCAKDLASTLIEARKSRMAVGTPNVKKVDMDKLGEAQRVAFDEAEALGGVAAAISKVAAEFRGYGYATADQPYEDDWMIANLQRVLNDLGCGEPLEIEDGDAPNSLAGLTIDAPLDAQDVDMSAA